MAAGFTLIDSDGLNHTIINNRATTNSITPAVGDIIVWGGNFSVGTNPSVTGGGMTWTQVGSTIAATSQFCCAFEATSGTPSAGTLTMTTSSDDFADAAYAVIRPTDLDSPAQVGSNTSTSDQDTLTVSITGSGFGGLLAWFYVSVGSSSWTQATDSGWTSLVDINSPTITGAGQVQYRTSDDTEVIWDGSVNKTVQGIVLSFASTAAGTTLGGLVGSGGLAGPSGLAGLGGGLVG
jgi:hypothetical protein